AAAGRASARLPLGEVLIDRGQYEAARALLGGLPGADPAVVRARARALQRGGDPAAAQAALCEALGRGGDPRLRDLYGRLLLARGAFAEARTLRAGAEIEGLAALYLGEHAHAQSCFARVAASATDDLARARAALLLGNAAHLAGNFSAAADHFTGAL